MIEQGVWLQIERLKHVQIRYQAEIIYCDGGETLEKVAQKGCGYTILGTVQGQAGGAYEQPGLAWCSWPWQGVGTR